jgi:hypothetical protein
METAELKEMAKALNDYAQAIEQMQQCEKVFLKYGINIKNVTDTRNTEA